jgi:hypothetical protein
MAQRPQASPAVRNAAALARGEVEEPNEPEVVEDAAAPDATIEPDDSDGDDEDSDPPINDE